MTDQTHTTEDVYDRAEQAYQMLSDLAARSPLRGAVDIGIAEGLKRRTAELGVFDTAAMRDAAAQLRKFASDGINTARDSYDVQNIADKLERLGQRIDELAEDTY